MDRHKPSRHTSAAPVPAVAETTPSTERAEAGAEALSAELAKWLKEALGQLPIKVTALFTDAGNYSKKRTERAIRNALLGYAAHVSQAYERRVQDLQDGLARMQTHRDHWREYAYGKREKPHDFLDGNKIDRGETKLETDERQLAELKDELMSLRKHQI